MSELVVRAVEAAAIDEYESWFDHERDWNAASDAQRDFVRAKVRPHVLVALGVVADHCTTEAEWMVRSDETHPGTDKRDLGAIEALSILAAELRETPE